MNKLLLLVFIASILLNTWLLFASLSKSTGPSALTNNQMQYPHLSQKILSEYNRDLLINFTPLRSDLRKLVQDEFNNELTLYFEYLPTGTSIGVNEKVTFYTASLLKVPTIIAYYRHIERSEGPEKRMLTLSKEDIDNNFGNLWKKGAGYKISADDAVRLALRESDNTAVNALGRIATKEDFRNVYEGLDIVVTRDKNQEAMLTAKSYASILKALFYGAIISKEHSEVILSHLTLSIFNDKLSAGIPSQIPVAHKIGVWEKDGASIYADCGIVYLPRRPYLLCIASHAPESVTQKRMKKVSARVYTFVKEAQVSASPLPE